MLLFLLSCEKELDFKYHDVVSQLVIEGMTSQEGTSVRLTYTCPMGAPMNVTPVTDAEVSLKDLTTGDVRELYPAEDGTFRDSSPGTVAHDYEIRIQYENRVYQSSCVMMPPAAIVGLEFQWIKMPYDHVAVLQISLIDNPADNDCYWIKIYRNNEPYKWITSDDRSAVNGIINEVVMTSRKDLDEEDEKSILRDGDEISVVINPIDRSMYDYLIAIQSDSNGPQMFSGDFCLGYYIATSETRSSIIFHPDELKEYN